MSDSLQPHESQHTRPPCSSPNPRVYSDSCPLSRWCHPVISSSVVPFSCPQSLPASGSFPMSQFFSWGSQSIGVSASASVLPMNPGLISFRMDWLDLLVVQGTLKSLLQHHSSKVSILWCSAFFTVQLSHPYMTTGKTIALTRWTFVGKIMSLLFNMLPRLVITFLPRSKYLGFSRYASADKSYPNLGLLDRKDFPRRNNRLESKGEWRKDRYEMVLGRGEREFSGQKVVPRLGCVYMEAWVVLHAWLLVWRQRLAGEGPGVQEDVVVMLMYLNSFLQALRSPYNHEMGRKHDRTYYFWNFIPNVSGIEGEQD